MEFFGRHHGEAFGQVEAHLVAENRDGARARTVFFFGALFEHAAHQVMVLFHGFPPPVFYMAPIIGGLIRMVPAQPKGNAQANGELKPVNI
jgi:hypothetical protein